MTMQNGNTEVVDGDVVDEGESASVAIVPASPGPALAVTPTVTAEELVERLNVIKNAADNAMTEGVDYGKVPGTDKPTLFKPGAEKLSVLFQLDVQLRNEKIWDGRHLTVISHATVFHAPTGSRLGYGEGICSTRERKYAYRTAKRACPECGAEQINRSKFPPRNDPDADPGWYCYAKVAGCGANFAADDQRIVGQTAGEIENPDLPDLWNTVVKMGEKRARVDAVLAVTGASAIFTQDIEDQSAPAPPVDAPPDQSAPVTPPAAALPDAVLAQALAAIKKARMPSDWLRMQLVALGAGNVPEGQIMRSTIQALTEEQADKLLVICDEVVEARAAKS